VNKCPICRYSKGNCTGGHYHWNKETRSHEHRCDGYSPSPWRIVVRWIRVRFAR